MIAGIWVGVVQKAVAVVADDSQGISGDED